MDRKRAKIRLKEYLRKLDENTKDLPMSKESSPIVTKNFNKGSKLKDLIGPVTVQPSGTQETTVEGKLKRDTKAGSVGIGTKFGNITLSKSKINESMQGFPDFKTKSTGVDYDKTFEIGKDSRININLRKGKTKSDFGDSKTKGATITFTKEFNKGGMCRGMGKAIRGGKFTGVK